MNIERKTPSGVFFHTKKTTQIREVVTLPRTRSPNRDKAYQLWQESDGAMLLKDIAAQLGVSESQIRKWKNQDKWEQSGMVTLPNTKSNVTNQKGAPKGNQNAVGNDGGAPPGNLNAIKHGAYQTIYAAYLQSEEKAVYEQMPGDAGLESEIRLLRLKITRLLNRQEDFFYDMFGNRHDKKLSEEDREAGILACMKQLEKLVRTQNQLCRRALDDEEQRARIAKLQAETARMAEEEEDYDGVTIYGGELLED